MPGQGEGLHVADGQRRAVGHERDDLLFLHRPCKRKERPRPYGKAALDAPQEASGVGQREGIHVPAFNQADAGSPDKIADIRVGGEGAAVAEGDCRVGLFGLHETQEETAGVLDADACLGSQDRVDGVAEAKNGMKGVPESLSFCPSSLAGGSDLPWNGVKNEQPHGPLLYYLRTRLGKALTR